MSYFLSIYEQYLINVGGDILCLGVISSYSQRSYHFSYCIPDIILIITRVILQIIK